MYRGDSAASRNLLSSSGPVDEASDVLSSPESRGRPVERETSTSIILYAPARVSRPLEVLDAVLAWLSEQSSAIELVIVVDGNQADLTRRFREKLKGGHRARLIALNSRRGTLAAIRAGIAVSKGSYVITFPAYPQVDCVAMDRVLAALEAGATYVVGIREKRRDSRFNQLVSSVYNRLISLSTDVRFHDIACGVHGFRREVIPLLPAYGDHLIMLPILASREGLDVIEVPVPQDRNEHSFRVYSPAAYVRRAVDLLSLAFLVRFTQKPLRPFGLIGGALLVIGLLVTGLLVWQRLVHSMPLAERPLLLLGLLLITTGVQVIILGLLGELLVYLHFRNQVRYHTVEVIEPDDGTGE